MRTPDFTNLWRSTIGFDHLADLVEGSLRQATEDHYPPYNIERTGDDRYRITLAVAGFGLDDLTITSEQNVLTVEGKQTENPDRQFLYRGIASRPFRRVFNLADYVQVHHAAFHDGMLVIDLVREVPEAKKPRRIEIDAAGAARTRIAGKWRPRRPDRIHEGSDGGNPAAAA
jgi:molecular chaperone IbpA